MDMKKMLDKLEDFVFGYTVIVMLSLFGALMFFNSLEANIMAMIGIFFLLIALIGFKVFEEIYFKQLQKINSNHSKTRIFTIMSPDGSYHLDINDAHEAIQKLGYLEHQSKIGDENHE